MSSDDDELGPMPSQRAERFELPDDDEFNAWLLEDLPAEGAEVFDIDPRLPPELQEEHDRLLAKLEASTPSRLCLAPDLLELERNVEAAALHKNTPPVMVHRFRALASIRGGMGLVLKAYDPLFERLVALKLLMRPGPRAQELLLGEAVKLAKLKHRNVVTVYEPGLWHDHLFIVMEWIEGVDAHEWMRQPRTWRAVRDVFIEAGAGLAAAHDAKIQHGDFKPPNVLVGDDGRVVVVDFGLADSLASSSEREASDRVAGTTSYMAPERLRGQRGDARSDQFSFCVAMFRALCHQRPFAGETSAQLIEAIERAEIQETPGVDVPRWLIAVLRKGLACSPDERYRDMRELLDALRDEPPLGEAAHDDDGEGDDEGRVRHDSGMGGTPRGPSRWGYLAAALISSIATLLGVNMLTGSPTTAPAVGAVEIEPYIAILGLVAEDRFIEAQYMWLEHESDLTDEQSLQIARECLARGRESTRPEPGQRGPVDRTKAEQAAWAADQVAGNVQRQGGTPERKELGGQLAAEARIYGMIAADEFAEAEQLWRNHQLQLSDEQSLQLARDCLERAKQVASVDRIKVAAKTSHAMADKVDKFGGTRDAKATGAQLAAEAWALHVGRPLDDAD